MLLYYVDKFVPKITIKNEHKPSKMSICNYRPISLTGICSKIMERVIYAELLKHTLHLIDDRQHGFLHNRSCATNMVNLVDSVSMALLSNTATDVIYFDLQKLLIV